MNKTFIAVVVIIIVAVVGWKYFNKDRSDEQVFCTQDAMLCPDGSYVGRTGPKCEFVCPE